MTEPSPSQSTASAVPEVPVVLPDPDEVIELLDPRIRHDVEMIERGPFAVAVCRGCGWESFARRSRRLARSEGRDHQLLHDS
jgi:hypothetical protein